VALVISGLAYRAQSMMTALAVVGSAGSADEKGTKLAGAISSAAAADRIIAVGALLIAGTLGALIAERLVARRSGTPRDGAK
jgi:hypothetical protein